ncbi:hypothetical protein ACH47Z_12935 [Streptomyces sp. NPDC020192]|uniref:hypothetical protein n=1 Tax=Streptomyces sp. NPDC020192 TaxID=3365066 RepID=UPI0037B3357F
MLVLSALAVGIIGTIVLTVKGIRATAASGPRGLVLLGFAVGLGLYTWGLFFVMLADAGNGGADSVPPPSCRNDSRALHVTSTDISFVPLRVECRLASGGQYSSDDVPGYVNPGAFGAALASTLAAVLVKARDRQSP